MKGMAAVLMGAAAIMGSAGFVPPSTEIYVDYEDQAEPRKKRSKGNRREPATVSAAGVSPATDEEMQADSPRSISRELGRDTWRSSFWRIEYQGRPYGTASNDVHLLMSENPLVAPTVKSYRQFRVVSPNGAKFSLGAILQIQPE